MKIQKYICNFFLDFVVVENELRMAVYLIVIVIFNSNNLIINRNIHIFF